MVTPVAPPANHGADAGACELAGAGVCAKAGCDTSKATAPSAAVAKRFIKSHSLRLSTRPENHVPAAADERKVLVGEAYHGDIGIPPSRRPIAVAVHPV